MHLLIKQHRTPMHSILCGAVIFLIVSMTTTRLVWAERIALSYSVEEEAPAMTPVGDIVRDSNVVDFVPPGQSCSLRFSFLTEGNPDAAYFWINSTSGEIKTARRYVDTLSSTITNLLCFVLHEETSELFHYY